MKKYASTFGFFAVLISVFIFEGLGIREGRIISRIILYIAPMILYGLAYWKKKQILLPFNLTILFILFLIGTSLSTLNAVNIQYAFEHQLYYISLALICIYILNHQYTIKQYVPYVLGLITVILLAYTSVISLFLSDLWPELLPVSGFQYVYGSQELFSHHPIGAFLLIPLTYLYTTVRQKPTMTVILIVLVLFLVMISSFLRASYLAFLLIVMIDMVVASRLKEKISLIHKFIIIGALLITFVLFLSITTFKKDIYFFSGINEYLRSNISLLSHKSIDNARFEFLSQSYRAIRNDPVLGIGSYNFYYASQKYTSSYDETTGTSHNIFVDFWVENGFVAFAAFSGVIIAFFLTTRIHTKIYGGRNYKLYLILVALLILFQLSHYHKMYSMMLVFFTIFMLLYKEKSNFSDRHFLLFKGSIVVAVIGVLVAASYMLNSRGYYVRAATVYPIALEPNLRILYQYRDSADIPQADLQAEKIAYLYPKEPDVLEILGDYYRITKRHDLAFSYYYSALLLSPHDLSIVKNTYLEMSATAGKPQADLFIQNHFSDYEIGYRNPPNAGHTWFYDWCNENNIPCHHE